MKRELKIWVIRSGPHGEAHSDFLKGRIVLGWKKLKDLNRLKGNQKAFRAAFRESYDRTPGAVRLCAGELYRFRHKLKPEHIVIYPGEDGLVHIGKVVTDYSYKPDVNREFPHLRRAKWHHLIKWKRLPFDIRKALSGPSALYRPRQELANLRKQLLLDSLISSSD